MNQPIFVRGMSRSGGTLTVTLLDAHPQVSMIYEFYPNLLDVGEAGEIDFGAIASVLERAGGQAAAAAAMPTGGLEKLVKRAPRARLDEKGISRLIRDHLNGGDDFATPTGRLRFVERCGHHKMQLEDKVRWGAKCGTNFDDYIEVWPQAKFINVIRDGRDVLASQLNTGDFQITPSSLGRSWARNHERFRTAMRRGSLHGFELVYERFVRDPVPETRRLLDFLEIDFDESIVNYHDRGLNIFRVGHMSLPALRKPINASQIGRWRRDLTSEQVDAFLAEAGEAMAEFGYLEE